MKSGRTLVTFSHESRPASFLYFFRKFGKWSLLLETHDGIMSARGGQHAGKQGARLCILLAVSCYVLCEISSCDHPGGAVEGTLKEMLFSISAGNGFGIVAVEVMPIMFTY